ncbi:MAG: hypothetical protein FJ276_34660, partial [Planctomycetes bacterium]|nr:hypothetical protein [Planctomycetota bacterium]
MPNYLFRGGFDYPPVVPLIMAFVPTKAALFLQALFSPLVDALHGVLAFTLVVGWTGDLLSAGLAQTMFALVPITALENSQFTGRSAGSLLMTIAIVGPACFFAGEGWTWLVSGMLAGLLVHMTHKMASQTLVFLSLLALPLALRLPGVVIAGPSTVLAALGVFGRAYRRVLAGQIHVLKFFREVLAEEAPRSRRVESPTFVGTLVGLAKRNFLVTAVGADPWVLPIVAAAVLGSRAVLPADIARVIL